MSKLITENDLKGIFEEILPNNYATDLEAIKDALTVETLTPLNYTTGTANTWTKVGNITIEKRGIHLLIANYNNSAVLGLGHSSTSTTSANAITMLAEHSTGATISAFAFFDAKDYSIWTKCTTASKSNQVLIYKIVGSI